MLQDLLSEKQLVLVLENKIPRWHLSVDSLNQVDPELFKGKHARLPNHVKVAISDLVKDKLVFWCCAIKSQHCASVVVSLLEH